MREKSEFDDGNLVKRKVCYFRKGYAQCTRFEPTVNCQPTPKLASTRSSEFKLNKSCLKHR